MDLVLLQPLYDLLTYQNFCFNPYFNGSSTSTLFEEEAHYIMSTCFNPYFNGSSTSTVVAPSVYI